MSRIAHIQIITLPEKYWHPCHGCHACGKIPICTWCGPCLKLVHPSWQMAHKNFIIPSRIYENFHRFPSASDGKITPLSPNIYGDVPPFNRRSGCAHAPAAEQCWWNNKSRIRRRKARNWRRLPSYCSWFMVLETAWFQWPFQDPIDWRYLLYIRPYCKAYVREYTHKIWPYMVQYLQFRILELPLMIWYFFSKKQGVFSFSRWRSLLTHLFRMGWNHMLPLNVCIKLPGFLELDPVYRNSFFFVGV